MSEIVTRVYLIRHGETELNQNQPGYCGWTDVPLNDKGRAQASALGRRFAELPLAAVLCSDLERARATAEQIAAAVPGAAIETDIRFRELNYGEWEGATPERLAQEDAVRFQAWKADPEHVSTPAGETLRQVADRSMAALEDRIARHQGQTIALVSHKTTVRLILCTALGIPLNEYLRIFQQNAAINLVEVRPGTSGSRYVIGSVNDTCHLPGDLCSPAL